MSDINFYFRLLSRRFPAMAALILLCTGIGIVIALRLPTSYTTSATLLVEAPQISTDLVRTVNQVSSEEQLEVIQQRLLTRANLLKLAWDNRVFPNQSEMDPDEVVQEMRQRTQIRRTSGRDRATLMQISFRGQNPRRIAAVVNQYVSIVLEANSATRTERAEGTLEFFQQEVDTLSSNMDAQSARIVEFKNENADALPENLEYRLSRQSLLQERLARAERDLEGLRDQRRSIEQIYDTTGTVQSATQARLTPEQERLRNLQSELRVALSIYSETNPKVRLLRSQIEKLEMQIAEQAAVAGGVQSAEDDEKLSPLDVSLAELDSRIEALERDIADATEELEQLRLSIARTPSNRIALDGLERELANTQAQYTAAVERLSQARMGERIELSAKGERITVLEPASVPTSPSGPNRAGIMGLGLVVGLGLAGLFFVLLELLNQKIRRPVDIERAFEITPLSTIPRFETVWDRRRRRAFQIATLVVVLVTVPATIWAVDTYYMPLEQLFEKINNRLL